MLKILTYINAASLVLAVGVGGLAYLQRDKIKDSLLNEVKEQLPSLIQDNLKTRVIPKQTGFTLPL
tara:strand:+ start:1798 stop:1995 length:198 start_codon:yes stop_codon:yes gene_type:complete